MNQKSDRRRPRAVGSGWVAVILLGAALPAQVPWETSLAAAREKAAAERKPILVAVHLWDGRGSLQMVQEHLARDAARMLRESVNLFVELRLVPDAEPPKRRLKLPPALATEDLAALNRLLEVPEDRFLAGPQWIWLTAEGKPIVSAAGRITGGELEWLWLHAVRALREDFPWQPGEAYRAPRQVKFAAVATTDGNDRPPTDAEVAETLAELRKSRRLGFEAMARIAALVRTNHQDAIDFVTNAVRQNAFAQFGVVGAIAQWSPRVWYEVAVEVLERGSDDPGRTMGGGGRRGGGTGEGGTGGTGGEGGGEPGGPGAGRFRLPEVNVRALAADALESLAHPKALPAIKKAWGTEKVEAVQGSLLRAMAACGPTDRGTMATIDKVLKGGKSEALRAQATLAAALLADREAVTEALSRALRDESPLVRGAAAYAVAWRRDRALQGVLDSVRLTEADAATRSLFDAAFEAIRGGSLDAFDSFVKEQLGRRTLADLMPQGGRGGGRGGGGGSGSGG